MSTTCGPKINHPFHKPKKLKNEILSSHLPIAAKSIFNCLLYLRHKFGGSQGATLSFMQRKQAVLETYIESQPRVKFLSLCIILILHFTDNEKDTEIYLLYQEAKERWPNFRAYILH